SFAFGTRVARLGLDLVGHRLGGPDVVALAGAVAAQVVHHHLGAMLGQHQAMLAAHAARPAGDDRHPSLAQCRYCSLPSFACLNAAFLGYCSGLPRRFAMDTLTLTAPTQ